jgi:hypothetical protein
MAYMMTSNSLACIKEKEPFASGWHSSDPSASATKGTHDVAWVALTAAAVQGPWKSGPAVQVA